MIGDSIRAIIDLLMLRKTEKKLDIDIAKGPLDIKKTSLDIEKAEREKAKATTLLVQPQDITIADIQKYDPIARRVAEEAQRLRVPVGASHHAIPFIALVALVMGFLKSVTSTVGQVVMIIIAGAVSIGVVVLLVEMYMHFFK